MKVLKVEVFEWYIIFFMNMRQKYEVRCRHSGKKVHFVWPDMNFDLFICVWPYANFVTINLSYKVHFVHMNFDLSFDLFSDTSLTYFPTCVWIVSILPLTNCLLNST